MEQGTRSGESKRKGKFHNMQRKRFNTRKTVKEGKLQSARKWDLLKNKSKIRAEKGEAKRVYAAIDVMRDGLVEGLGKVAAIELDVVLHPITL